MLPHFPFRFLGFATDLNFLFNKLSLLGKLCALIPNLFVENNLKHSDLDCSFHSRFSFLGRGEASTHQGAFQWPDTSCPIADEHFKHCVKSLCNSNSRSAFGGSYPGCQMQASTSSSLGEFRFLGKNKIHIHLGWLQQHGGVLG